MTDYKYRFSLPTYIESFIKDFKKGFCNEKMAEEAFTNGNCYHFAAILSNLFEGYLMYNPVDNHFAFMDDYSKTLWDITGRLGNRLKLTKKKNWYLWEDYKKIDLIETQRIIEQCMYKVYNG